jgi:hypothetical protein
MRTSLPAALAALVRRRAGDACEYCRLPQSSQEATFHLDHIVPLAADGPTTADNLAVACVTCSLKKAARSRARDPKTKRLVRLYHPRRQAWSDHFRWTQTWWLVGRTPTGRATIAALGMNRLAVIAIRRLLAGLSRFP